MRNYNRMALVVYVGWVTLGTHWKEGKTYNLIVLIIRSHAMLHNVSYGVVNASLCKFQSKNLLQKNMFTAFVKKNLYCL